MVQRNRRYEMQIAYQINQRDIGLSNEREREANDRHHD